MAGAGGIGIIETALIVLNLRAMTEVDLRLRRQSWVQDNESRLYKLVGAQYRRCHCVMAGLGPATHDFAPPAPPAVNGRHKAGHDTIEIPARHANACAGFARHDGEARAQRSILKPLSITVIRSAVQRQQLMEFII